MLDLELDKAHVLVSGANGGIGLVTVKSFLEQGAYVTAQYNSTSANLDEDEFIQQKKKEGRYQAIRADVTKESDVAELFKVAEEGSGGKVVSSLIVNHAIYNSTPTPIHLMTLTQFQSTHEINLTGSFLLIRSFLLRLSQLPSPLESAPSIILIGSTAGQLGEANHADYASSKSALTHGFMLSIKNEIVKMDRRGRICTVAPGWVGTKMAEESLKDEGIKYMAMATTPLKKIATPQDVANSIIILASSKISGHITGEIVMVSGGMEGRLLNPQ